VRPNLRNSASFEEIADILGNSPDVVRKQHAKWSINEFTIPVNAGILRRDFRQFPECVEISLLRFA
jgi:hypothetical protein